MLIFTLHTLDTDKLGILKDGAICCEELGLDFDEVYKRTNTSYTSHTHQEIVIINQHLQLNALKHLLI